MKLQDALNLLGLFGDVSFEDCQKAYRRACMKYHPDRNAAGHEMMQAINAAWKTLQAWDFQREPVTVKESTNNGYGDALMDALNAVIHLPDISIEVCGSWIWISGNTKPVKDALKTAGFKWASKKYMWYFRPPEYRSKSRGKWSMDKIRANYGSDTVDANPYEQVA